MPHLKDMKLRRPARSHLEGLSWSIQIAVDFVIVILTDTSWSYLSALFLEVHSFVGLSVLITFFGTSVEFTYSVVWTLFYDLFSLQVHLLVADTRLLTLVWYVRHIFEFLAVFALLLLPNRPRLDCRASGLVSFLTPFLSLPSSPFLAQALFNNHISP